MFSLLSHSRALGHALTLESNRRLASTLNNTLLEAGADLAARFSRRTHPLTVRDDRPN
jgi:hypothetical protein